MRTKEAVEVVSLLLAVLRRKAAGRQGMLPAVVILNEYAELHDLLGTIEGFLSDKNIVPYVRDLSRVQRQLRVARWLHEHYKTMAQNNQLSPQAYQNYEKFTATLDATIEDKLQDTNTLINTTPTTPSYPSILQKAYRNVAMIVLGLATAYTTPTFAQDVAQGPDARGPPVAEKTETKDTPQKEERDYVAEFEAEYTKIEIDTKKTPSQLVNAAIPAIRQKQYALIARLGAAAIEKDSEFPNAYNILAVAYCLKGETMTKDEKSNIILSFYKRALPLQEKAVSFAQAKLKKTPSDTNLKTSAGNQYATLAEIQAKLGDNTSANESLKEAETLGASDVALKKTREKIQMSR